MQDFLRGSLNIEVISEAGGLGNTAPQKLSKYTKKFLAKYGVGCVVPASSPDSRNDDKVDIWSS